jgi:glycosyltransferase involved in cell wall biosynthesis
VLLRAWSSLEEDFQGRLWIHGANLDTAPAEFQDEFRGLLEAAGDRVRLVGRYGRDDLAKLMGRVDWVVIPSIWWETGPLTVGEAFQHGRPVICSDMGGMSEKVKDGVNGLHFRRGDPDDLADALRRAAADPALWERLRRGIPRVPTMAEHVEDLSRHYRRLLARAAAAAPGGDGKPGRVRVPDTTR